MYKIKAKRGFNVILKNLGISLRSEVDKWVYVSKEQFDNCPEAKASRKYILIEGIDVPAAEAVAEEQTNDFNKPQINVDNQGILTVGNPGLENPEGTFVAEPKSSVETIANAPIYSESTPVFVAQPPADEEVVEETVAFVAEPVEERETPVVEVATAATEKKSAAKTATEKKTTEKKTTAKASAKAKTTEKTK